MSEVNYKKQGVIIGGFKAIGKSTLSKKYDGVIDVDTSDFQYIIDENLKKIPYEQRKGLTCRIQNREWPMNYYNKIMEEARENKIVIFGCKKEIVDLLNENNVDYLLVYPEENMLDEIIDRCRKRGNIEEFILKIKEVYYADYPSSSQKVIWLKKGQFLEEVLLENNLLNTNEKNKINIKKNI